MSSIMAIGLSGMKAAEARLQAAASNIANVRTAGRIPDGGPPQTGDVYQPVDVVQLDTSNGNQPGGVSTSYAPRTNGYSVSYDPESPFANAEGQVAEPNIDLTYEIISAMIAKYEFAANAKMLKAGSEMYRTAIDTLA